jgi:glycosyltransferase involved in cell wall biosynthesis
MKVSGFTFIRNAVKYDYPVVESIKSLLPLVDELIVAVGNSDDGTREMIENIGDAKIKIIDTIWDDSNRSGGAVLAVETNKAFAEISNDADWAFYLQGDECLHEQDYAAIKAAMLQYKDNKKVEGLLFKYNHFFGNYSYLGAGKQWYRNEIRIIRNNKNITAWKDAQGFRFFDKTKLHVKKIDAHIYHYGWVKHPSVAQQKAVNFQVINNSDYVVSEAALQAQYDYYHIDKLAAFTGTHPAVIKNKIKEVNWEFEFDVTKTQKMRFKHKVAFFIESLTGYRIGEYKNYKVI